MIFLGNYLIAILAALLWAGFLAPAILRALGVPMAYGLWRLDRRNKHLSKRQYIWGFGVVTWGVGMILFNTICSYLVSKPIPDRPAQTSAARTVVGLLSSLIMGWLFGVLSAPRNNSSGLPVR